MKSSCGSIQPVTSDLILGPEWQGLDSGDLGNTWDMSFPTLWDLGRLYDSEATSVDISGDNTLSRMQLDGLEQFSGFTSATPIPYPLSRMDLEQSAILDSPTKFLDGKGSVTMTTACTAPGLDRPRLPNQNMDYDGSRSIIQENHTYVEACLDKDDNDLGVLGWETAQCDTCFGEVGAARYLAATHANAWKIVGTATSTFKGVGGRKSAGVNMEPFGNVLKLSFRDSGKYAGIVSMAGLVTLFEQNTVKLVGTLFAPDDLKGKKSRPDVVIRMILYGRGDEKEAVGACLSKAGVYLQHPRITEYDDLMPYANPQFLIRPGSEMPKLEDLVLSNDDEHSQSSESLTQDAKSEIMRIFDSANTVNGPYQGRSSSRLASTLKEHQIVALSMMVEREAGNLQDLKFPLLWERVKGTEVPRYRHKITSRVEAAPRQVESLPIFDEEQLPSGSPRATLIITPKSTIYGWEEQIKRHIQPGQVRYLVYHGPKRRETQQAPSQNYDIVITTYHTLLEDWRAGSGLHSETWYRVALDEAHKIRNRSSQIFKAVTSMKAHLRWCLTGTPSHNSLDDYGALLSFMGVDGLRDKQAFDSWIANPVRRKEVGSLQRLQYLVAATAFRRTKAMVKTTVELPKKVEKIESVQLTGADRELYEFFKSNASKTVDQLAGSRQVVPAIVDLTAANFVHLLEPHWNPMAEAQAVDRVHRIGQSREVLVTRYLVANSIEDYVRWIQEDKMRLISQSLGSAASSQSELDRRRLDKLQLVLGRPP
ncbi:hypothetical protein CNMCM6106_006055 [Aspergillus hiratsukae]|uniref:Helicase ATP-binding domain-containing protein n=1 Tax=Aspergillus hiratsukae TaxID=1194566 RepID=A0A8H6UZ81_9EURO|nr:hypothetical protein CNMCM6106_006055 [Aspergillus hiratsukae]